MHYGLYKKGFGMFQNKKIFHGVLLVALSLLFHPSLSASVPPAFGGAGGGPSYVAPTPVRRLPTLSVAAAVQPMPCLAVVEDSEEEPEGFFDVSDEADDEDDADSLLSAINRNRMPPEDEGLVSGGVSPVSDGDSDEFQRAIFSAEKLERISTFADTIFKNTAEAIFSLKAGQTADQYVEERLLSGLDTDNKFNAITISVEDLRIEFGGYIAQAHKHYHEKLAWMHNYRTNFFSGHAHDFDERKEVFIEKKIIRAEGAPPQTVLFMGDIHGSVHALLRNLLMMRQLGYVHDDFSLAPNIHVVFLGDLTDRGLQGIESVYTILRLKNKNWSQVHIARGNHESGAMIDSFGFGAEIACKYPHAGESVVGELREYYAQFCSSLPSALFLGFHDDTVGAMRFMQCCHGGIAPHHDPRPLLAAEAGIHCERIRYGAPHFGKHYEWNDVCCVATDEKLSGRSSAELEDLAAVEWAINRHRGPAGDLYVLHRDDITKLLNRNGLFMLMRGHQDQGSPCKVLQDGEDDPVSWRVHERFDTIQPVSFFRQGIRVINAPNCFTLTNATEARSLFAECLFGITFGPVFSDARVFVLEVDLMPNDIMDWWRGCCKQIHESHPLERNDLEYQLYKGVWTTACTQRDEQYFQYDGLPVSLLQSNFGMAGPACTGEATASPAPIVSDGEIKIPGDWTDEGSDAGLMNEESIFMFQDGAMYMPDSDPAVFNFGKGSVEEALGTGTGK